MYALLKILKDEHELDDPDTMKAYPIMDQHIQSYKQICPDAEFYYNRLKNDETRKMRFLKNPMIQKTIHEYHKKYIAATGPMPPLPEWKDLTPINSPNFLKNLNKSRKNRKSRRNRKSRHNRKN